MAADQEQFYQILTTLLSTDNNIRSQAEVSPVIALFLVIQRRKNVHEAPSSSAGITCSFRLSATCLMNVDEPHAITYKKKTMTKLIVLLP